MSLAFSSSAFFIQSTSFASAKPLQSPSLQSTPSSQEKSGSSATDAFAEVFARSQATSTARPQIEAQPLPATIDPARRSDNGFAGTAAEQRPDDRPPVAPDTRTARDEPKAAADPNAPSTETAEPAAANRDAAKPRHSEDRQAAHGRGRSLAGHRAEKTTEDPSAATSDTAETDADDAELKDLSTVKGQGGHHVVGDGSAGSVSEEIKTELGKAADDTAETAASVALPLPSLDIKAATLGLTVQLVGSAATVAAGSSEAKPSSAPESIGPTGAGAVIGQAASLFLKLALKADGGEAKASADQLPTPTASTIAANGAQAEAAETPNAFLDAAASLGVKPATGQSTAASAAETGIKALGAALKAGTSAIAPTSSIVLPQALAALSADAPQGPQALQSAQTLSTTLAALPVAIGSRALNGVREFTIHLYPAELGKVEVKLEIGDKGDIRANLTVDRVETLQLLQRDAHSLHQALEQAGFKPSENSIEVSLRQDGQQAFSQRQTSDQQGRTPGWSGSSDQDETELRDVTLQALAAYQRRGTGALDIHV